MDNKTKTEYARVNTPVVVWTPCSKKSNLWKCIVWFKQKSSFYFIKKYCKKLWQKDFYDHILREQENILDQTKYILENPIRKKIVTSWNDYAYKGSSFYDFNQWNPWVPHQNR